MRAQTIAPDAAASHIERARHADRFLAAGRHAAAERLLRDVGGALARRSAWTAAGRVWCALGHALLERGRTADAYAVFQDAEAAALRDDDTSGASIARIWQVTALTDAGQLSRAEALCRRECAEATLPPDLQTWACAALARILLWQARPEAIAMPAPMIGSGLPAPTRAFIDAVAVRALIALGRHADAGCRARRAMTAAAEQGALSRLVAHGAHLHVLAGAGDLELFRDAFAHHIALARAAHAPLRTLRARLLWHDTLVRAGADREAGAERRRLGRARRAAPMLLRRAIDERLAGAPRVDPRPHGGTRAGLAALIHLTHRQDDPHQIVHDLAAGWAVELSSRIVGVAVVDRHGVTRLVTGSEVLLPVMVRALESGCAFSSPPGDALDAAVPARLGPSLVGAVAARWTPPADQPPSATASLQCLAALAAPFLDVIAVTSSTPDPRPDASGIVGVSPAIDVLRHSIAKAARAPFTVLIEGESGVGKELVARAIHAGSLRRSGRFLDLNCAALADDLLDSELFGHVRGAFTGALADRAGLFEQASGGTLFLDEVADLSPRAQAKLLRALQQQEVRRVGEATARAVDVRLIAAANRDMRTEAAAGRFRPDLLYRLDVIRIRVPPLRERAEDVAVLAQHCWRAATERVGSTAVLGHAVLAALTAYPWPGNVRELQNVVSALAVAAPVRGVVTAASLPAELSVPRRPAAASLADVRAAAERRCVRAALAAAGGNRTAAARALGLSRQGLLKTMGRLGLAL